MLGFKKIMYSLVAVVVAFGLWGCAATQEEAESLNSGFGTADNPIPSGQWVKFKPADIRVTQLVRPAQTRVEGFSALNEPPAAGADYVLLWFELKCNQDFCRGITPQFQIFDETGSSWGEVGLRIIDPDFNGAEAVSGATFGGWELFEVPQGRAIQTIEISWGGVKLHVKP